MRKLFSIVFVLIVLFTAAQPVEACDPPPPTPEYLKCNDLGSGYQFGFRVRYAPNGRFRLTSGSGTLTGGAPSDPENWVRILNSNGYTFDWQASLGVDAVIVNAGGKSRVVKEAEDLSGGKVTGKTDSKGKPYKITSVEFCYDYEMSVYATAKGVATTGSAWQITKGVAVPRMARFAGETAKFDYTVAVRKTTTGESGYKVRGELEIKNTTPLTVTVSGLKDRLQPGDRRVSLDCGKYSIPVKLSPGKTLTCTFSEKLEKKLDGKYTVEVYTNGSVGGDYDEAGIEWTTAQGGSGPSTVNVTDTQAAFGGPRTTSSDANWTYAVEATCPADPALYTNGLLTQVVDNTAAIVETKQSASAQAVLDCYLPSVTQGYQSSLDVQYNWEIEKIGSVEELILKLNQTKPVDYTVSLYVTGTSEVNPKLTGTVTVTNPHPAAALTGTVTVEPASGVSATMLDCTNPVTVPAGGTLTCNYEASLASAQPGSATASFAFNSLTVTSTTAYNFDAAARGELDECVTVLDDKQGALGEVCSSDPPKQFAYPLEVGGLNVCESSPFINTATYTTNDTLAQGTSSWMVFLHPDCSGNVCINVTEYWIQHADPANYDSTWDQVGNSGPQSLFFDTGDTWITTLARIPEMGTDPRVAVYRGLSRDFITATLNMYQGSQVPQEVTDALVHAQAMLDVYDTEMMAISDEDLAEMTALQELLNSYNNGGLGQPVCCN